MLIERLRPVGLVHSPAFSPVAQWTVLFVDGVNVGAAYGAIAPELASDEQGSETRRREVFLLKRPLTLAEASTSSWNTRCRTPSSKLPPSGAHTTLMRPSLVAPAYFAPRHSTGRFLRHLFRRHFLTTHRDDFLISAHLE